MTVSSKREGKRIPEEDLRIEELVVSDQHQVVSSESPEGCLSLTRLYLAALRSDLSGHERHHIDRCSVCQRAQHNIRNTIQHPDANTLLLFVSEGLSAHTADRIAAHLNLEGCLRCAAEAERAEEQLRLVGGFSSSPTMFARIFGRRVWRAKGGLLGSGHQRRGGLGLRRRPTAKAVSRTARDIADSIDRLSSKLGQALHGRLSAYAAIALTTVTVLVSVICLVSGAVAFAGVLLVISFPMEMIDGQLARLAVDSRRAVFVDFAADRLAEIALFSGIAWTYVDSSPRFAFIILLFLALALFASFVRAQGAALGFNLDAMQVGRAGRLILISAALLTPYRRELLLAVGALTCLTLLVRLFKPIVEGRKLDAERELKGLDWGPAFPARLIRSARGETPTSSDEEDPTQIPDLTNS